MTCPKKLKKELKTFLRKMSKQEMLPKMEKVKSTMTRSFSVENLLPQNVGSIINYLQ